MLRVFCQPLGSKGRLKAVGTVTVVPAYQEGEATGVPQGGALIGPRRGGVLTAVNRRLGRMSMAAVTVILLSGTLVAAIALHVLLAALGVHRFGLETVQATAIVTVVVVTPIIVYAQSVIRELLTSRRALRLMTDRLAWALHNAEQANEAKSTFIASMSNELRTPLNAIIGFSDIMANQRLGALENPRYRGYAQDINVSGAHLL